jgi:hypothetical protein
MTREERLDLIDRLQRANDESRVEIARRVAAREANPFGEAEQLLADCRLTHDPSDLMYSAPPEPEPLVEKSGEADIIYRRYDGNATAGLPEDDPELVEALDRFAAAVENRLLDLERENTELRGENIEVKGLLRDALEKFSKLEGKCDAMLGLIKPKVWKP